MSFKTLLVHIDDSDRWKNRLDAAIRLALGFRASLTGVYLVGNELTPSVAALLPDDVVARRLSEAADAQKQAERAFRAAAAAADLTAIDWRAPAGAPIAAAVAHGRCADLFVLGQRDDNGPGFLFGEELIASTMLSTGRPTLLVPHIGMRPSLGDNVLIAWDGGREASRAIADALPLLERARKITVIAVNPDTDGHTVDAQAASRLTAYLHHHGIDALINRHDVAEVSTGEWLLSRAADLGADLIVMGGYGHTRLRELVLGGVTRTMLQSMTVPVLMSH